MGDLKVVGLDDVVRYPKKNEKGWVGVFKERKEEKQVGNGSFSSFSLKTRHWVSPSKGV